MLIRSCAQATIAVLLTAMPSAMSVAGSAEGDACAKNLAPTAQLIYAAAAPEVGKDSDIRELLRTHAHALVAAGKLARDDARPAAQAAAGCLKALQD